MKKLLGTTLILSIILISSQAYGAWLFSSKTGKWINLRKKPKETPKLQFDYAKSFEEKKQYKQAIQEYDKFIYNFSPLPLVPEARYRMGICYENIGQYYEAFKQYKKILEEDISYENIREVIQREYQIGNVFFSGKRKKMWGRIPSIASPLDVAVEVFENILTHAPYSEYAVKSLYRIAEVKQKKKEYKEAIEKFNQVVTEYNNLEYKEAASFQIVHCKYLLSKGALYAQESTLEAIRGFDDFLEQFPDSTYTKEATEKRDELRTRYAESLLNKGVFYEKEKKYESALIYYEELQQKFGDLEISRETAKKIEELKAKKEEPVNENN